MVLSATRRGHLVPSHSPGVERRSVMSEADCIVCGHLASYVIVNWSRPSSEGAACCEECLEMVQLVQRYSRPNQRENKHG